MNDKEQAAFRIALTFYDRWRSETLETESQWQAFADDVGWLAEEMETDHCVLARHLFYAVLDIISELYKGGKKPEPAGYFGRDDL